MSGNSIRQYEVDGVLVGRGPLPQDALTAAGIGALGATYPAGPVLFLLAENLTTFPVCSDLNFTTRDLAIIVRYFCRSRW